METLRTHFSYEKDLDSVPGLFENLSKQLKVIHSNNMVVPRINSDEIYLFDEGDDSLSFRTAKADSIEEFEQMKRQNIVALAKLMIGTYVSSNTGFRDFSNESDEWFHLNFDDIFDTFTEKDFDREYFSSVLLEGNNYYYSDYLNRKRQSESLEGKQNIQGYKKVLRTAGSELYQDLEEEEEIKEKAGNIQITFNPLLIGISLAIITVLLIMYALVK